MSFLRKQESSSRHCEPPSCFRTPPRFASQSEAVGCKKAGGVAISIPKIQNHKSKTCGEQRRTIVNRKPVVPALRPVLRSDSEGGSLSEVGSNVEPVEGT